MTTHWSPGDAIAHRFRVDWHIVTARPVTVVFDTAECLGLWLEPGALCKIPDGQVETQRGWLNDQGESRWDVQAHGIWRLKDWVWKDRRFLILTEPASYYSISLRWSEAGEFLGWYVNFEEPAVRTLIGLDTTDLALDLVVDADGHRRWKDEAEYDEGVRRGLIAPTAAAQVEQARAAVLERLEAGHPPFDSTWKGWQPDPAWPVPELPRDWNLRFEPPGAPPTLGSIQPHQE